jgi:hypothetical protein
MKCPSIPACLIFTAIDNIWHSEIHNAIKKALLMPFIKVSYNEKIKFDFYNSHMTAIL